MIASRDPPKGATFAGKGQPRASKNAHTGELGGGFRLALTAPALGGRANQACVDFFANLFAGIAILRYHSLRPEQPEKSNSRRGTLGGGSQEATGERTSLKEAERLLNFSERLHEIRTGFERPFWVANITELFERLSYYAAFSSLARYLHETLNFGVERASSLTGLFGGLVWFLAIFGGALADRLGFRRSLSLAYLILSCSYFLLGSIGSPWLAPVRNSMPLVVLVAIILTLPALGIALVKPCVVGTTARASKENVRSIGYSIYYTLVNVGGAAGPYLASWVHQHVSVENVFRMAALSVFLMFFLVLLLFEEPRRSGEAQTASLGQAAKNFLTVLSNPRFMLFLLIFSGYYIAYWQSFIVLPLYIHDYINPRSDTELVLVTDSLTVIALQMAVSFFIRKMAALRAITLGTLISGLAWLILIARPTVPMAVLAIFVVALGEITQQPRYYEYISRLAPPGQQGTYMGFAFLPIGIGSLVGGWFGGVLLHHFGEVTHQPARIWWAVTAVGVLTGALLWVYDRFVARGSPRTDLATTE